MRASNLKLTIITMHMKYLSLLSSKVKPDYSFKDRQLILIMRDWPQGRNLRDLWGTWLSNAECVCVCVCVWREREKDWGLIVNSNLDTNSNQPNHDTGATALPAQRLGPRGPAPITISDSIVCCVWEDSGGRCTLYHTCQQTRLAQSCVQEHTHTHTHTRTAGAATRHREWNWVILSRDKDSGADSRSWNLAKRPWQCHIMNSRSLGGVITIPVTTMWKKVLLKSRK